MKKANSESVANAFLLTSGMLYLVLILLMYIYSSKEMRFPFNAEGAPGVLVFPFALIIMDIITEIYGYSVARVVFWAALFAQAVFCFLVAWLALIPDYHRISEAIPEKTYETMFLSLPHIFLACFIAMMFSVLINSRLIAKWRVLLKGRYFWLRSIGASGIGEVIFVFGSTFIAWVGRAPLSVIFKCSLTNYLIDMCLLIILAPIANIVIIFLKIYFKDKIASAVSFKVDI
jgi:uncharacterized integral membrane protein (TIGR00697 family)